MAELTKDIIKFVSEIILLLIIFSVLFGEDGIASNTFYYLTYVEPIVLQNWLTSAVSLGSYSPGNFEISTETTGQAYTIRVYTENGNKFLVIQPPADYYLQSKFATLEPTAFVSDCLVRDQEIRLQKNIIQKLTVKKIITEDGCEMQIAAYGGLGQGTTEFPAYETELELQCNQECVNRGYKYGRCGEENFQADLCLTNVNCGETCTPVELYCDDGYCNNGETCSTCAPDCGNCPSPEEDCVTTPLLHVGKTSRGEDKTKIYDEIGNEIYFIATQIDRNERQKKQGSTSDASSYQSAWLQKEDIEALKDYGANLIELHQHRLSAFTDNNGNKNQDYFDDWLDVWVDWCKDSKIYCIIDMANLHIPESNGLATYSPYNMGSWIWDDEYDYNWWKDTNPNSDTYNKRIQAEIIHKFYASQEEGWKEKRDKYVNIWGEIAAEYKDEPYIMFSLFNEPLHHTFDYWDETGYTPQEMGVAYTNLMNRAIKAIRDAESEQIIFVNRPYVTDNWVVWHENIVDVYDPLDNVVWETHHYFDDYNDFNKNVKSNLNKDIDRFINDFERPLYLGEYGIYLPGKRLEVENDDWEGLYETAIEHFDSSGIVSRSWHEYPHLPGEYYDYSWPLSSYWLDRISPYSDSEAQFLIETVFDGDTGIGGTLPLCDEVEPEPTGSRVYIDGNKLMYKGKELYLAGASWGGGWNIANTNPYGEQSVEMVSMASDSGSNFIFMVVNTRLYNDYHDEYMENLEEWVDRIVDEDMFFVVKLHDIALEHDTFSGPGSNYKIAQSDYWGPKSIEMLVEMAEKWEHLPNFIGISPLNEPYDGGYNQQIWNDVNDFYVDVYNAVKVVDLDIIIFATAPQGWGGAEDMSYYRSRGHVNIPKGHLVYEYHNYYDIVHANGYWGLDYLGPSKYVSGNRNLGKTHYNQFLDEYVVPIMNDGYPVLCGEFGTRIGKGELEHVQAWGPKYNDDKTLNMNAHIQTTYGVPSAPLWREAIIDQFEGMQSRGIHYADWRLYKKLNKDHTYAMNKDDLNYNDAGIVWADKLPDNLVRPSYQTPTGSFLTGSAITGMAIYSDEIFWSTRHENGGIIEWTKDGGFNGHLSDSTFKAEEYGGEYVEASTLTLVEDFLGKNWIRSRIDKPWVDSDRWSDYKCRAEIMRRGNFDGDGTWVKTDSDIYYGVRIYLPPDFKVETGTGDWARGVSLVQLRGDDSKEWGGGLRMWTSTQDLRINSNHYVNGEWVFETLGIVPIILDEPFTVIFHINSESEEDGGVFEAWIDGELVAQDYDDYRMGPNDIVKGYVSRYLQVGLYTGIDQNIKEMYFTDAVVASSLEAVKEFLGSDSPTPSPSCNKDGYCNGIETCDNCPEDCGNCPSPSTQNCVPNVCCCYEKIEEEKTCQELCEDEHYSTGTCIDDETGCDNDGNCEAGETYYNCPNDCPEGSTTPIGDQVYIEDGKLMQNNKELQLPSRP